MSAWRTDGEHCMRCRSLDLDKLFDPSPSFKLGDRIGVAKCILIIDHLTQKYESLVCPLCRFFAASRNGWPDSFCALWRYRMDSDWSQNEYAFVVSSNSCATLRTAAGSAGYIQHERASRLRADQVRRRSQLVDFGLVNSWITECHRRHRTCGQVNDFEAIGSSIQLIDCETQQICAASQETKYAALSYVWGTDQPAIRTERSMILPSDLPLLITDAMCATKSLGLKYLWVDRYCITETDKTLKHEQIRKMDLIYGRAQITIISLGKDPSCGLPGISTEPRSPQMSLQVGRHNILGSMPNPKFAIESSKWWTRAWTLQEAVLSTRRLYFTQDQVYFECRQGHRCEAIEYKPNFIQRRNDRGPWGLWSVPADPGITIESLQNIIRVYFQRDMTYPTDTIPAISGILRRHLTAVTSTKCYFGLPFKICQDSLSGTVEGPFSQRGLVTETFLTALLWGVRDPTRRQEYPSWSWAGWYGKTLWFSSQALDAIATVWVERPGAGVERIEDFYKTGGFDLAPSKQSRFIWLEAPAVRLKFIHRSIRPDVTEVRVVLFWGGGEKNERSFHQIGRLPLPTDKELEQYSDFMLFRLGEVRDRPGISAVMLVADRDGQKERIWSSTYGEDVDADYGDSKKEWEPYNRGKPILPKGINLRSWDKIVWEIVKVRIG